MSIKLSLFKKYKLNNWFKTRKIWIRVYLFNQEIQNQIYKTTIFNQTRFLFCEKIIKFGLFGELNLIYSFLNEFAAKLSHSTNFKRSQFGVKRIMGGALEKNLNLKIRASFHPYFQASPKTFSLSLTLLKYWFFYFFNKKNKRILSIYKQIKFNSKFQKTPQNNLKWFQSNFLIKNCFYKYWLFNFLQPSFHSFNHFNVGFCQSQHPKHLGQVPTGPSPSIAGAGDGGPSHIYNKKVRSELGSESEALAEYKKQFLFYFYNKKSMNLFLKNCSVLLMIKQFFIVLSIEPKFLINFKIKNLLSGKATYKPFFKGFIRSYLSYDFFNSIGKQNLNWLHPSTFPGRTLAAERPLFYLIKGRSAAKPNSIVDPSNGGGPSISISRRGLQALSLRSNTNRRVAAQQSLQSALIQCAQSCLDVGAEPLKYYSMPSPFQMWTQPRFGAHLAFFLSPLADRGWPSILSRSKKNKIFFRAVKAQDLKKNPILNPLQVAKPLRNQAKLGLDGRGQPTILSRCALKKIRFFLEKAQNLKENLIPLQVAKPLINPLGLDGRGRPASPLLKRWGICNSITRASGRGPFNIKKEWRFAMKQTVENQIGFVQIINGDLTLPLNSDGIDSFDQRKFKNQNQFYCFTKKRNLKSMQLNNFPCQIDLLIGSSKTIQTAILIPFKSFLFVREKDFKPSPSVKKSQNSRRIKNYKKVSIQYGSWDFENSYKNWFNKELMCHFKKQAFLTLLEKNFYRTFLKNFPKLNVVSKTSFLFQGEALITKIIKGSPLKNYSLSKLTFQLVNQLYLIKKKDLTSQISLLKLKNHSFPCVLEKYCAATQSHNQTKLNCFFEKNILQAKPAKVYKKEWRLVLCWRFLKLKQKTRQTLFRTSPCSLYKSSVILKKQFFFSLNLKPIFKKKVCASTSEFKSEPLKGAVTKRLLKYYPPPWPGAAMEDRVLLRTRVDSKYGHSPYIQTLEGLAGAGFNKIKGGPFNIQNPSLILLNTCLRNLISLNKNLIKLCLLHKKLFDLKKKIILLKLKYGLGHITLKVLKVNSRRFQVLSLPSYIIKNNQGASWTKPTSINDITAAPSLAGGSKATPGQLNPAGLEVAKPLRGGGHLFKQSPNLKKNIFFFGAPSLAGGGYQAPSKKIYFFRGGSKATPGQLNPAGLEVAKPLRGGPDKFKRKFIWFLKSSDLLRYYLTTKFLSNSLLSQFFKEGQVKSHKLQKLEIYHQINLIKKLFFYNKLLYNIRTHTYNFRGPKPLSPAMKQQKYSKFVQDLHHQPLKKLIYYSKNLSHLIFKSLILSGSNKRRHLNFSNLYARQINKSLNLITKGLIAGASNGGSDLIFTQLSQIQTNKEFKLLCGQLLKSQCAATPPPWPGATAQPLVLLNLTGPPLPSILSRCVVKAQNLKKNPIFFCIFFQNMDGRGRPTILSRRAVKAQNLKKNPIFFWSPLYFNKLRGGPGKFNKTSPSITRDNNVALFSIQKTNFEFQVFLKKKIYKFKQSWLNYLNLFEFFLQNQKISDFQNQGEALIWLPKFHFKNLKVKKIINMLRIFLIKNLSFRILLKLFYKIENKSLNLKFIEILFKGFALNSKQGRACDFLFNCLILFVKSFYIDFISDYFFQKLKLNFILKQKSYFNFKYNNQRIIATSLFTNLLNSFFENILKIRIRKLQNFINTLYNYYGGDLLLFCNKLSFFKKYKKSFINIFYVLKLTIKKKSLFHSYQTFPYNISGFFFYGFSIFQKINMTVQEVAGDDSFPPWPPLKKSYPLAGRGFQKNRIFLDLGKAQMEGHPRPTRGWPSNFYFRAMEDTSFFLNAGLNQGFALQRTLKRVRGAFSESLHFQAKPGNEGKIFEFFLNGRQILEKKLSIKNKLFLLYSFSNYKKNIYFQFQFSLINKLNLKTTAHENLRLFNFYRIAKINYRRLIIQEHQFLKVVQNLKLKVFRLHLKTNFKPFFFLNLSANKLNITKGACSIAGGSNISPDYVLLNFLRLIHFYKKKNIKIIFKANLSLEAVLKKHKRVQYINRIYKLFILPSNENLKNHVDEIKNIVFKSKGESQEFLIRKISLKIYKWSNYYKMIGKDFKNLDFLLMKIIWKWCFRRHNSASQFWVKEKYFFSINNKKSLFSRNSFRPCQTSFPLGGSYQIQNTYKPSFHRGVEGFRRPPFNLIKIASEENSISRATDGGTSWPGAANYILKKYTKKYIFLEGALSGKATYKPLRSKKNLIFFRAEGFSWPPLKKSYFFRASHILKKYTKKNRFFFRFGSGRNPNRWPLPASKGVPIILNKMPPPCWPGVAFEPPANEGVRPMFKKAFVNLLEMKLEFISTSNLKLKYNTVFNSSALNFERKKNLTKETFNFFLKSKPIRFIILPKYSS